LACERMRRLVLRAVDGDVTPHEALRAARHMTRCTSCRILAARERRLADALAAIDDHVSVDESLLNRVMDALASSPLPRRLVLIGRQAARGRRGRRMAAWLLAGSVGAWWAWAQADGHPAFGGSAVERWRFGASGDAAPWGAFGDAAGSVAAVVERAGALFVVPIPSLGASVTVAIVALVAGTAALVLAGALAGRFALRSPRP